MSLSSEQRIVCITKIDAILAASDINTISAKKIRLALKDTSGIDTVEHKAALNDLIKERFDSLTEERDAPAAEPVFKQDPESKPHVNGNSVTSQNGIATPKPKIESTSASPVKREASSEELSDLVDDGPPRKKAKKSKPVKGEDGDAAYAAKLQAQLNNSARPTRGGGATPAKASKATPKKKAAKKKSSTKISAADDSDIGSGGEDEKKAERGGAFNKPMWLSEPLKALLGVEQLSRPKTVKGIWAYVKENEMQIPEDKRQIRCDDALRAIFKQDSIHMFTMNKILSKHLTPIEEE